MRRTAIAMLVLLVFVTLVCARPGGKTGTGSLEDSIREMKEAIEEIEELEDVQQEYREKIISHLLTVESIIVWIYGPFPPSLSPPGVGEVMDIEPPSTVEGYPGLLAQLAWEAEQVFHTPSRGGDIDFEELGDRLVTILHLIPHYKKLLGNDP